MNTTIKTRRISTRLRRAAVAAAAATAVLSAGIVGLGATAADAQTMQNFSLMSHNGANLVAGYATQSGWKGTVTVNVHLAVRAGQCVNVLEQGHNLVTGYGNWVLVKSACNSGGNFSFNVSDYYSDSVAIKITDPTGSTSTHVWN